tara:strand:+ start:368 stop:1051 length:684 start_codon:yes stop_codon:yes gene_type:complete
MSIKLKHSGGNSVSLNPPTSAPTSSEVAFKLPNADGSAGQVLKTDGSGNLSWVTPSAGKILQVQATNVTAQSEILLTNHSTLYDTPLSVNITTTAANSKIILSALFSGEPDSAEHNYGVVLRRTIGGSGTSLSVGDSRGGTGQQVTRTIAIGYHGDDNDSTSSSTAIPTYLDSPAQSSGTTINYKLTIMELGGNNGNYFYVNKCKSNSNGTGYEVPASYITVMEVAA